ncbi:MAG: MGH1-like glycoside hydrolase domain-containing protein, partial [Bacillota bacterium]
LTLYLYRKQWLSQGRPLRHYAEVEGAPFYIAGSTSGSPLSELGSHCGFKSVIDSEAASCSALYATITSFGAGRIYDFAAALYDEEGKVHFSKPQKRAVKLYPNMIEEKSADSSYTMISRLYFLQTNLALWETTWEAAEPGVKVKPAFKLLPTHGRDLENPYPHFNGFSFFKKKNGGLQLADCHRIPGQRLYIYFLPISGTIRKKKLLGPWLDLKPGEKQSWSVIISFSADDAEQTVTSAERALSNLEALKAGAKDRWEHFENRLPLPYESDCKKSRLILKLAAWALENSLYYPRNKMKRWGSVPSKVYFPFIWGWDTPQHVIGLSEWNPQKAGDILLTQLEGNYFAPRQARFKLKIKGITFIAGTQRNLIPSKLNDALRGVLDFYSQPPLQSWSAARIYERLKEEDQKKIFLTEVLPPLRDNLRWWEENRKLHNGFFSYINGLESGLDDSPRFYPPSFLPSFVIGLVPRFFSAIDLNCWIFQSYINTAYLCEKAGENEAAFNYRQRGRELKNRIEHELWSEKCQAWLDKRNGKYIEVITPSVWWPVFVGATADLDKVKAVIEKYLLHKDKFWGSYGIPSVAFDDPSYNSRKDGYYWRGQIWMINNYSALEVLFRYGYCSEAEELHNRIIETAYRSKGLYETYNALTGEVGWSSRGPGDPAVMQFGMSSGWATQMVFYRYQHFRYIFPETKKISGYIKWASTIDRELDLSPPSVELDPRDAVLEVEIPGQHSYNIPRINLESTDGRALLDSTLLRLFFENQSGFVSKNDKIKFTWKGESFMVKPGREYVLRPFALSNKISSV